MLSTLANVERVDLSLVSVLFQLKLQLAFTAAEVSYNVVQVLGLLELSNDHIERVLVPFLNLVAVTFVVLEQNEK